MIPGVPLWLDRPLGAQAALPAGTSRFDTVVVGGGFAGLSIACRLLERRPGARVALLEAERLGAGASGRTTGMLGPGVGQDLAGLVRRLGAKRAAALYRATLRAVEETAAWLAREGVECGLRRGGQFMAALGPRTRARLRARAELMEILDLPHRRLDDAALARHVRLRPDGRGDERQGPAALAWDGATLDPGRLVAGLAERVRARGGALFESARVLAVEGRGPLRLRVQGGAEVVCDEAVVGVAGYAPALGLMRGRILPVHLQVVATAPLDEATRAELGFAQGEGVLDARRIFDYYRTTGDGRLVFGGGLPRYRWGGRTDDGPGAAGALDRLAERLGRTFALGTRLRPERGWTGLIGYTLDALPAIARLPDRPGLIHVGGWCGHGVALSLAAGAWVTSLLCDGAAPADLPWFRPSPPWVPSEPGRFIGFHASVRAMDALDRVS